MISVFLLRRLSGFGCSIRRIIRIISINYGGGRMGRRFRGRRSVRAGRRSRAALSLFRFIIRVFIWIIGIRERVF